MIEDFEWMFWGLGIPTVIISLMILIWILYSLFIGKILDMKKRGGSKE